MGSKNFSENVLLGKMAIILMQSAGANVTDLTNIPGSASARQAMLDGQIQAMWEYTGTGWITYLGHEKPIPDEEKQYTAVRDEDLKKNQLVWLKPAPMNNTYGFAITKKVVDKYKITKLSELKKVPARSHVLRRVRADQPARRAQGHAQEVRRAAGHPQGRAHRQPEDLPDRSDLRRDRQGLVQLR